MTVRDIVQAAAGVSTGNPNAWDISKAYLYQGNNPGDVSTLNTLGNLTSYFTGNSEYGPNGVYVSPDGSKFYLVGSSGDLVYESDLTYPWSLEDRSLVRTQSISAQMNSPTDIFFKPDGTRMYISDASFLYQYNLTTPWNISTSSFVTSVNITTYSNGCTSIFFRDDGLKVFILTTSTQGVVEYDLSTAWDITTLSYVQNFNTTGVVGGAQGLAFLGDGTKMYLIGTSGDGVYEYTLSTPWNIATSTYTTNFYSISYILLNPLGLHIKSDGSLFFISSSTNSSGFQTSQVLEIATGGYNITQDTLPYAVYFKPDGTTMYVAGRTNRNILQYSLSTPWDIYTASYVQAYNTASDGTLSTLYFKPDGLSFYVVNNDTDMVRQYNLSTAWDVSTASYFQEVSISTWESSPWGIYFKDDGTIMYLVGVTGDDVNQFALSTPWDISTISYTTTKLLDPSSNANPYAISFKSDGTKMYINRATPASLLQEYDLSTPWQISSATLLQQRALIESRSAQGLYFRPDGEGFFTVGSAADRIQSYLISRE